jgi:dihydrofolate reductase
MRKLIVDEFLSLDGVSQAPGGPEEDTDGGFKHGGWHMRYTGDEVGQRYVMEGITTSGGLVLGRRTYQIFAGYWPTASEDQQVIAQPLNSMPKYVVSTTLSEPLDWQNSYLVNGDLTQAIDALKQEGGGDLHVIGSTQLVKSLTHLGLVDVYRIMIDPVVVGGGKSIFPEDGGMRELRLVESKTTPSGVILATYAKAA